MMTLSAGSPADPEHNKPEGSDHDGAGTALEPSLGAGSDGDGGLAPFLAAAGERIEGPRAPRSLHSKLLDYSAHAAMIVGLLGFAWTIGDHVGTKHQPDPAPAKIVTASAIVTPPVDEAAEMRRSTQKMAAEISALRLSLESLRSSVKQDKTGEQLKALTANIDGVKAGLTATKSETNATLAQLSSKIDHLPHVETAAKLQQVADRLDKMERQNADMTTTASVPAKAVAMAVPPVKPQITKASVEPAEAPKKAAAAEPEPTKKPPLIAEWVVRDVYDGVAVVESKRGPMEVVPGVTIPGAGVVKSINRQGSGWTVTTSKGLLAYAPPPRDHGPRDYYRSVPEDF